MFVVISGCSGGGKSTLVAELATRGFSVVEEPGRRILAEQRAGGGHALPWIDRAAFGRRALAMSTANHDAAQGLVFFDRGVVDAAVAITSCGGDLPTAALTRCRYHRVYLAPPWPDIYENDADRRHSFETASRDYERIQLAYVEAGYAPIVLPRSDVSSRADLVLADLHS